MCSPAGGRAVVGFSAERARAERVRAHWPNPRGKCRMTVQSYQPQVNLTAYETPARQKRIARVFVTLAVLAGFVFVALKYHDSLRGFLLGTSNQASVSTSDTTAEQPGRAGPAKSRRASSAHRANGVAPSASEAEGPEFAESTIRPPLVVEVIYGSGQRQIIRTRDDSIYLDLRTKTMVAKGKGDTNQVYGAGVVAAAEQSRLSSAAEPVLPGHASVDSLVAKQQSMEGSVMLLARIGKDGSIENLQVVSGPENLYDAAREAVREWRFKPYYKAGQAVETDAQITVKFAIAAH